MLNDITEYRQMKRFLLSLMMAACLVGNIAAQEQLDSLSYAMGDYSTRKMTEEEAGMCLTKYYETLYDFQATQSPQLDNGGDIDDPALEEALKEAFKKAEEETATKAP